MGFKRGLECEHFLFYNFSEIWKFFNKTSFWKFFQNLKCCLLFLSISSALFVRFCISLLPWRGKGLVLKSYLTFKHVVELWDIEASTWKKTKKSTSETHFFRFILTLSYTRCDWKTNDTLIRLIPSAPRRPTLKNKTAFGCIKCHFLSIHRFLHMGCFSIQRQKRLPFIQPNPIFGVIP